MAETTDNIDVPVDNKYRVAFNFFDVDGRGKVSVDQLANVVYSLVGEKIAPADMAEIAREMNADEEGTIVYEGFVAALQKQELTSGLGQGMAHIGSLLRAMSVDETEGALTFADWQGALSDLGLTMSAEDVDEVQRQAGDEEVSTAGEEDDLTEDEDAVLTEGDDTTLTEGDDSILNEGYETAESSHDTLTLLPLEPRRQGDMPDEGRQA